MAAALRIALEIKAEPALIDALTAIARALGVSLPAQATSSVPASPEPSAPRDVPKPAPSLAHIAPAPPPDGVPAGMRAVLGGGFVADPVPRRAAAPAAPAQAPTGTTMSQVRDAAKLLNDKGGAGVGRPALVALLAAHGAQSLANLPEARYADFVAGALVQAQA